LEVVKSKEFSNGKVYALKLDDNYLIETTDTFLPYYTKNAIGQKQNCLQDYQLGSRFERWMIGVSVMSGCPVGCKFCATGQMKKFRNLEMNEIINQLIFVLSENSGQDPYKSKEFKINYTRMGEPFLNINNVKRAISCLNDHWPDLIIHHYISTIGIKDSDFSWIKDNITLQISLHSLNEEKRNWLIPYKNKMTIKELGQIRTKSNLKTTLNLTLVDESDFDINVLREYFDPEYFFIKLSPINPNIISNKNNLGLGVIEQINLV
jgi:adenine C2-methylase RlmN of 23S rRNA A2503 and tRNA A37